MDVTRRPLTVNQSSHPASRGPTHPARRPDPWRPLIASPLMNAFAEAAFGADPGRWPLPAATTPTDYWLRAVAAGGQGRYGQRFADLDALGRTRPAGRAGLARVQHAGVVPASARRPPRRPGMGRPAPGRSPVRTSSAGTDALVGLAADALGVGRFAAVGTVAAARGRPAGRRRASAGCRSGWPGSAPSWPCSPATAPPRSGTPSARWTWRREFGSARHDAKSQVVLAAALCSAGDIDGVPRRSPTTALAHRRAARTGAAELGFGLPARRHRQRRRTRRRRSSQFATRSADIVASRGGAWTAR